MATNLRTKGNAIPTINKRLRYLRTAFKRAIRRGYAAVNPMEGWTWERENEPAVRVVSDAEEASLLKAATDLYGDRWCMFVRLALRTGRRRGELLALTWGRVNFDKPEILLTHTKGKKDRTVPPRTAKSCNHAGGPGHPSELRVSKIRSGGAEIARHSSRQAELVALRFFGGFELREAAEIMQITPETARNFWTMARAWLLQKTNRNVG